MAVGAERVESAERVGTRYVLGTGDGFYGVWGKQAQSDPPVARFPKNDEGWKSAWAHYSQLEGKKAPRQKRENSPAAVVGLFVVLLVVGTFVLSFVNSNLNIPVVSKITCSVKGGTWTDGSVLMGVPAGCYSVQQP
jgi:hypothetical protein